MVTFPYDSLSVGSRVRARRVRFRGDLESDALFSEWGEETVTHVQRDSSGRICEIAFSGYVATFDPRHQWEPGACPCLMSGEDQLQISGVIT